MQKIIIFFLYSLGKFKIEIKVTLQSRVGGRYEWRRDIRPRGARARGPGRPAWNHEQLSFLSRSILTTPVANECYFSTWRLKSLRVFSCKPSPRLSVSSRPS